MTSTVTAVSQIQSLAAIRNFVRASVSCITYARGLCSDNAFEQRPFLGLPLHHLIPSTTESITISEWIEKGAFDALNRHYLKEMSLCVYDAKCRDLLESYCFGFNYTGDRERAQMTLNASQAIAENTATTAVAQSSGIALGAPTYRKRRCTKQEVQRLLTSILERLMDVVESLPPLLSERVLTMRLTYYDEVTPATYEPPCFAPASVHMVQLYRDELKHHVHIGSMDTSHHLFSVAIRHPLLQQIHSQMTQMTMSKAGAMSRPAVVESTEAVTQSDPLRSGLESSFSSDPGVVSGAAADDSTPVPRGVVGNRASGRPCSHTDRGCARVYLKGNGEEEAGSAPPIDEGGLGAAEAARLCEALRPCDVKKLAGTYSLLEQNKGGCQPRRLKPGELAYLLFLAFALSKAPSARGGRGELTAGEMEAYRTQRCPLDVSAKAVDLVLERLSTEGFLQQCDAHGAPVPKSSKTEGAGARASAMRKWYVPDPPASLLEQLLKRDALTELLTHDTHLVLQELFVYVMREESRNDPQKRGVPPQKKSNIVGCV
ncbi:hypothetical protein JKF63_00104 [Porcisia hertigi]|uniref:HORMA domain-containing protein n=1 Tax=Porcisia hertigi TaxID=2761500 RepID=A0A836I7P6_9TRYP|nr:hypothetical protein JKF63_00104 [Porcisia hertigi]